MAPGLSKLSICSASIVILSEIEKRRQRKKRRMWKSSLLKGRNYVQLLSNLKADKTGLFKNFNRMSSSDFDILLNKIEDKVSGVDTNYRGSIPASVRLALTQRLQETYMPVSCTFSEFQSHQYRKLFQKSVKASWAHNRSRCPNPFAKQLENNNKFKRKQKLIHSTTMVARVLSTYAIHTRHATNTESL